MKRRNSLHQKYRRLPPHSNEAQPLTNLGEAKKPLVIALITIGALIVLALLLFFSGQFVGKAISFGVLNANEAGVRLADNTITDGQTFPLTVRANIGTARTVAVEFRMTLPNGMQCDSVAPLLGWTDGVVVNDARCVTDDLVASGPYVFFSYATLNTDEAKAGIFDIATITLTETGSANSYPFAFSPFTIIDLDSAAAAPLALTIVNPTITIEAPGVETHSCTGDVPANAELCFGDDQDLLADFSRILQVACTEAKCEYTCSSEYQFVAGVCVADVVPDAPPPLFSTTTTITAQTNIPEAVVYTILKDSNGRVLVLKSEKIHNLADRSKYLAEVSYPYANLVASKEVNVWDKLPHQGRQVHGQLVRSISQLEESVLGTGIILTG